jgi:hypothetical protein
MVRTGANPRCWRKGLGTEKNKASMPFTFDSRRCVTVSPACHSGTDGPRLAFQEMQSTALPETGLDQESIPFLVEIAKRPPMWVARPVRRHRLLLTFGLKNGLRIGSRINDHRVVHTHPLASWGQAIRVSVTVSR